MQYNIKTHIFFCYKLTALTNIIDTLKIFMEITFILCIGKGSIQNLLYQYKQLPGTYN